MFSVMAIASLVAFPLVTMERSQEMAPERLFVRNDGQWVNQARFLAQGESVDLWVTDDGLTVDFRAPTSQGAKGHVVNVKFEGATAGSSFGVGEQATRRHYIAGNQAAWATDVPAFSEAWVLGVAEGVDARYYFDKGKPRYDLVLRAGVNPNAVRMRLEGASSVRVGRDGLLRYDTSLGTVTERGLFAYQQVAGGIRQVEARPVVNADQSVSYRVGSYDPTKPLVIDPAIFAPTVIGEIGAGTVGSVTGTPDGGTIIVGSTTIASFPTTVGAYDRAWESPKSGYVTKLNADQTLAWTTFFGSNLDVRGVALDNQSRPVIGGIAYAGTVPTTDGAFDGSYNGSEDGFVARLSADGSNLDWSSYVGGAGRDGFHAVALDSQGNAYLGGYAFQDFPVTAGAYDVTFKNDGYTDAAVLKLSADGTTVLAGTYVGDEETDTIFAIAVDSVGNVVMGGQCDDADFPRSRTGVLDSLYAGPTEGFVGKLTGNLSKLTWCTMCGGAAADAITTIAIGPNDTIAAGGWTKSASIPYLAGALTLYEDAFLLHLTPNGTSANGAMAGRYIGGDRNDRITGIGFDADGSIVAAGHSNSENGLSTIVTSDAPFPTRTGTETRTTNDSFLVVMEADASVIRFGTFLGISGNDFARSALVRDYRVTLASSRANVGIVRATVMDVLLDSSDAPPVLQSLSVSGGGDRRNTRTAGTGYGHSDSEQACDRRCDHHVADA